MRWLSPFMWERNDTELLVSCPAMKPNHFEGLTWHAFKFIDNSDRNGGSTIHAGDAVLHNTKHSTYHYDCLVPTSITNLGSFDPFRQDPSMC